MTDLLPCQVCGKQFDGRPWQYWDGVYGYTLSCKECSNNKPIIMKKTKTKKPQKAIASRHGQTKVVAATTTLTNVSKKGKAKIAALRPAKTKKEIAHLQAQANPHIPYLYYKGKQLRKVGPSPKTQAITKAAQSLWEEENKIKVSVRGRKKETWTLPQHISRKLYRTRVDGKLYLMYNKTSKQHWWHTVGNNGEIMGQCEPMHNKADVISSINKHDSIFGK